MTPDLKERCVDDGPDKNVLRRLQAEFDISLAWTGTGNESSIRYCRLENKAVREKNGVIPGYQKKNWCHSWLPKKELVSFLVIKQRCHSWLPKKKYCHYSLPKSGVIPIYKKMVSFLVIKSKVSFMVTKQRCHSLLPQKNLVIPRYLKVVSFLVIKKWCHSRLPNKGVIPGYHKKSCHSSLPKSGVIPSYK